ncbi:MAG TPA: ankyrin repeat domain-containing protein [Bacteroidetes bacterium]|nr:ankyrin repeat domain-containing protein [Bacteroidota bacterium]
MKKSQKIRHLVFSFSLILIITAAYNCKNKREKQSGEKNIPTAIQENNMDIVETFLDAAMNGDLNKVKQIVRNGMDVNTAGVQGRTALMLAAYNGHTDIVKYLLEKRATVNVLDDMGQSALIYAASGPFPETVKVLLDHKADPDIVAKGDGWTALMFAAAEGQLEVVKVLLAYGANPLIREKDGDDAESFARKNGHTDVAKYLHNFVPKK